MSADAPVVLLAVNFLLPEGDYRVAYATRPADHVTVIAAPAQPVGVPDDRFARVAVAEGLGPMDALGMLQLLALLVRLRRRLAAAVFYSTKLILVGPPVCRLLGVPAVAIVTGRGRVHDAQGLTSRLLRPVYRAAFAVMAHSAAKVAFQNDAHARDFAAGFPRLAGKQAVVRSALALPTPPRPPRRHDGLLRVVCVARLLPSKGIDDLLAVATMLADEPVECVLVGGRSPRQDALYRRVTDAQRAGHIDYRGRLPSAAVHAVYEQAHVLFLPSYGEGLARVFLEAAHFGLLPIGYDIDGNRDVLAAGAHVVPVGAIEDVAQVLKQCLADSATVEQRAAVFQAHVAREYSLDAYLRAMDRIVEEMTA